MCSAIRFLTYPRLCLHDPSMRFMLCAPFYYFPPSHPLQSQKNETTMLLEGTVVVEAGLPAPSIV
jgi:hypothetical protein